MTTRNSVSTLFFFGLLLFMTYQAGRLFAPFFGPLLAAALLAIVFYPLHRWFGRKFRFRGPSAHALLSDLLVFLFFVVPLGLLIWAAVVQVDTVLPAVKPVAERVTSAVRSRSLEKLPGFKYVPTFIKQRIDFRSEEMQSRLESLASTGFSRVAALGTALAKNTFTITLNLIIVLFSLFFFFRDGPRWYAAWNNHLPLSKDAKKRIDAKIHDTVIGVVRGTFLTSLAQSTAATIGYFALGIRAALFLGFLTFAATLIPSIGAALVWVPIAILLFIKGSIVKGCILIGWGVVVVGLLDNVLRPIVVGDKADLPFFWLFFAILGGIQVFGFKGLVLGPLILGIMPVLLEIYRSRFLETPHSGSTDIVAADKQTGGKSAHP
jgi:predicted PurR-regulated permease PerM